MKYRNCEIYWILLLYLHNHRFSRQFVQLYFSFCPISGLLFGLRATPKTGEVKSFIFHSIARQHPLPSTVVGLPALGDPVVSGHLPCTATLSMPRHMSTLNYLPSAATCLTRTRTVIYWLSVPAISDSASTCRVSVVIPILAARTIN